MAIYQKILVALDGSQESYEALRYALSFAKFCPAQILGLTVIQLKGNVSSALSLILGMEDLLLKGASAILKKAEEIASEHGIEIKTIIKKGDPVSEIIDCALSEGCDLIVIGKTGKTGLAKLLLGSTAYNLVAHSPVDVLVIPKGARLNLDKILVPTDGSGPAQRAAQKAISLANSSQGMVILLSCIEEEIFLIEPGALPVETLEKFRAAQTQALQEAQNVLVKRCELEGIPCQTLLKEGQPFEIILNIAKEKEVGLIAMGSYGRTGLKKLLLGSVAEKVLALSEVPVLVVKS